MKKNYSKPDILFESFSLSTSVAAGCAVITPLPQIDQCGLPRFYNWILFHNEIQGCNRTPTTNDGDGICYHPPTEQTNLFSS